MWIRARLMMFTVALACLTSPAGAAATLAASAPATVFDPEPHSQGVYFEGSDDSLREMAWTASSGWSSVYTIVPAGRLARFGAGGELRPRVPQSERLLRGRGWIVAGDLVDAVHRVGRRLGHHSGSGVIAPAPTPPAATPPAPTPQPTGTGSVTLAPSHHKHRGHTRLLWVKVGRVPGRTVFSISCRGRGCPAGKLHADAATLRRHDRTLRGKLYRAGDRLLVSLTAPSWQPERARITIRNGHVPSVRLL